MKINEYYDLKYAKKFQGVCVDDSISYTVKATKPLINYLLKFMEEEQVIDVLEVGFGLGYNVDLFNINNYNCSGIELSREFVDNAIKKYGPYYSYWDIEDKPLLVEYDLIYAFDVIEHLFDYNLALQNIYDSLKEGGYLALSTPNILGLRYRFGFLIGNYEPFKSYEHIRFFTPNLLKDILIKQGFKIIKIKTFGRISYLKALSGTFMIIAQK